MDYGTFLALVAERDAYAAGDVEGVVRAVVTALGDRLTPGSAEELAGLLPVELGEMLCDAQAMPREWGARDFVRRVAETTRTSMNIAEIHARAVLSVLREQVSGGEASRLVGQLPSGYAELFGYPEPA